MEPTNMYRSRNYIAKKCATKSWNQIFSQAIWWKWNRLKIFKSSLWHMQDR